MISKNSLDNCWHDAIQEREKKLTGCCENLYVLTNELLDDQNESPQKVTITNWPKHYAVQ